MGGLLAKETLRRLHARFGPASVHTRSVIGVVTLCMPATGSGLVNLLPGPAWRDRVVLRKYSQFQRDVDEFFSTWVDVDLVGAGRRQLHVPTFGASALSDRIVPAMAAELGLPAPQRTHLSGGHRSALRHSGTTRWLANSVDELLGAPMSRPRSGPAISAEFNGTGSHPHWESAYRLALEQFAAERGSAAIGDFVPSSTEEIPDLLIRAYSAQCMAPDVPAEVQTDVAMQVRSEGRMALGISPIGSMAPAAVDQLVAQVNAPRLRWFRGAADKDVEIVAAFREFLRSDRSGRRRPRPACRACPAWILRKDWIMQLSGSRPLRTPDRSRCTEFRIASPAYSCGTTGLRNPRTFVTAWRKR